MACTTERMSRHNGDYKLKRNTGPPCYEKQLKKNGEVKEKIIL